MFQNITLIGRTGQQPELRFTNTGIPVCNFSVAINEGWTAEDGQRHERVTWVRVTCWRKLAETVAEYLQTGRQVMVSGKLAEPRPWTTESGEVRANIEVTANIVQFLGSASDGKGGMSNDAQMAAGAVQANMEEAYANGYKAALQELAAKAEAQTQQDAAAVVAGIETEADDNEVADETDGEGETEEATDNGYRPSRIPSAAEPDDAAEDEPADEDEPQEVADEESDDDEQPSMILDASNMLDQLQNTISTETKEEVQTEPEPATVSEDIPF